MAWTMSTGMKLALLGGNPAVDNSYIASIEGDSTSTLIDATNGFVSAGFVDNQWVLVIDPAGGDNDGVYAQLVTAAAGTLTFAAGTITVDSATSLCVVNLGGGGSVEEVLRNGVIDCFSHTKATSADVTEGGSSILKITKDAAAFSAGVATNGLNLGAFSSTTLKRAVDPATGVTEVWRGIGLTPGGTGVWCRWYDNSYTTGASTTAVRMDGTIATSGGDLNMINGTTITTGVYSEVSDVSATMTTA